MQSGDGWGRAGAEGGRNSPSPQLIQYLCRAGSRRHWPLGRAVKQLPQPLHPNCCTCPLLWRIHCSFSPVKQILMAACAWRWEQSLPHEENTNLFCGFFVFFCACVICTETCAQTCYPVCRSPQCWQHESPWSYCACSFGLCIITGHRKAVYPIPLAPIRISLFPLVGSGKKKQSQKSVKRIELGDVVPEEDKRWCQERRGVQTESLNRMASFLVNKWSASVSGKRGHAGGWTLPLWMRGSSPCKWYNHGWRWRQTWQTGFQLIRVIQEGTKDKTFDY